MAVWLLSFLFLSFGECTNVYIEEEHHEVIPHWVQTVRENAWTKADLIHIDGHSDMDYPEIVENLAIGHHPHGEKQISAMMQRNDQFIQAAIIGQLLRTVYLVLPTWASNYSSAYNSSIGMANMSNGKRQFCACFQGENEEICHTRRPSSAQEDLELPPSNCTNRLHYHHIELNSRNAAGVLKHSKTYSLTSLGSSNPLILDIDEDFFGVQLVATELVNLACEMDLVLEVNDAVGEILCAGGGRTEVEMEIDAWFQQLVEAVKTDCLPEGKCVEIHLNDTLSSTCQAAIRLVEGYLSPSIKCSDAEKVHFFTKRLALLLSYHTVEQLSVLSSIGVCFDSAWRTHAYKARIGLCLGHNIPGNSAVAEFFPNRQSIIALGRNFTRILKAILPRRPDVITIARSSRDGYVVRQLQPLLESLIVKVVKRVFNITDENVHFSDYLAGGRRGWNNRLQHN